MSNEVRLIAGKWRRRKLTFPNLVDLRPSSDRVRETLFNWLQDVIPESKCLDLFAGSGALGLETLSRGAEHVTFVDKHPQVIQALKNNIHLLGAKNVEVYCEDAFQWLARCRHCYDIVFVDPPFRQNFVFEVLNQLAEHQYILSPHCWIYVETDIKMPLATPGNLSLVKQGHTTQVTYQLFNKT
ncbi:MAG: 16S rRNA (guanine(966)-N(2))-methyltransferase RsmD [Candidatus Competibacterales bacterium]